MFMILRLCYLFRNLATPLINSKFNMLDEFPYLLFCKILYSKMQKYVPVLSAPYDFLTATNRMVQQLTAKAKKQVREQNYSHGIR